MFIDARCLLLGEEFEFFEFVEIGIILFELLVGLDQLFLVGFDQGGDDVADIHGVIFGMFLVLLDSGLFLRDVVSLLFDVLRPVNDRALVSFLLRNLHGEGDGRVVIEDGRFFLGLDLEEVVEGSDVVVPVVDHVVPDLPTLHAQLLQLLNQPLVGLDDVFTHHDPF